MGKSWKIKIWFFSHLPLPVILHLLPLLVLLLCFRSSIPFTLFFFYFSFQLYLYLFNYLVLFPLFVFLFWSSFSCSSSYASALLFHSRLPSSSTHSASSFLSFFLVYFSLIPLLPFLFFLPFHCLIRKFVCSVSDPIAIKPKSLSVTVNHPHRVRSTNCAR
jgi:hypothetical protein